MRGMKLGMFLCKARSLAGMVAVMATVMAGAALAQVTQNATIDDSGVTDVTQPSEDASLTTGVGVIKNPSLTGVMQTDAKSVNLMDKGPQCMKYKWDSGVICCKECCPEVGPCYCCPGYDGTVHNISYWEPSEIIEVSCRTGYSMLSPGKVPSRLANYVQGSGDAAKLPQTCVGAAKPGAHKWFFEARVWTINGYNGKLRHKAMGGTNGERARQCTLARGDDLPWPGLPADKYWGYGVKWLKFSRGPANGPDGSWEAYMSDSDPNWALEKSGQPGGTTLSACKAGSNDMDNCWGPVTQNGWVTHSNPKVAAAVAAWRAHTIAQGRKKASPAGKGGFKMMMDYPYQDYAGPFGASMGMKSSGKTGSECFKPGDAGPEWYGGLTPEQSLSEVAKLTSGTLASVAEINPGVYIFTIWVHTSCTRYAFPAADPTPICHYRNGT